MNPTHSGGSSEILICLPAYNEASNLPELLSSTAKVMQAVGARYQIVVCDDGSRDQTPEILRQAMANFPLKVLTHEVNQGLGAAMRSLLSYAASHASDDSVVVTLDADNTQPVELIPQMAAIIAAGDDVVIASRYREGSEIHGLSPQRRFLSYGAFLIFKVVFPLEGVRDYTCGFRAYRASQLKKTFEKYGDGFVSEEGFQCMVDILLKVGSLKPRISEIPMILRYDLKGGATKMKVGTTVINTLRLLARTYWKTKIRSA